MKLYYTPGACSMAPHIVAEEAGLRYEAVLVDLKNKTLPNGDDFRKVNPKGAVPALGLDDGEVLTENAVILQYLADRKPESGLLPKPGATMERYRALEMLNYLATEVHKGFGPLWSDAMPEAAKSVAMENLARKWEFLAPRVKDGFLLGPKFSALDAYLFTLLGWTQYHKLDLSKWPALLGYAERVKGRPAVQTTLRAEGLLK